LGWPHAVWLAATAALDGRPQEMATQVASMTETLGLADVADRFHVPVGMSAAA
jgi:hypothetical protein